MEKYNLDPEISHFLTDSARYFPDDPGSCTIEDERHCYDLLCRAYQAPIPEGILFTDSTVGVASGDLKIRTYENPAAESEITILYFHGGGFILGGLESHHSICAEIADRCGYRLVAVDYRLAPEYTWPTQIEDAVDAFLALDRGKTIVAGDSAGGLLAAAVCISRCDQERQPVGQLLIYPVLGGQQFDYDSYRLFSDAPGLTIADIERCLNLWANPPFPWSDPLFAPLSFDQFEKLPPCIAIAAEYDPLKDDARAYVDKLNKVGVLSEYFEETGLIHGYLRARHCSAKASRSFTRICDCLHILGERIQS